jgi:hypothetical protein
MPANRAIAQSTDRQFWLNQLDKMVRPVLRSLAHDSLRINMPTTVSIHVDNAESRRRVAYLEVLGRTLSGIAPWLQLEGGNPEEAALRKQYRTWVLEGLKNALDTNARDFMRFDIAGQQLVDASYLALAFIRAPWLWQHLDAVTRERLVASIRTTRQFRPAFSNWLLFSIQERLINADGTYPAIGRSIIYRGAAFHHLADMAWRKKLPPQLSPAGVRCALTAVIRKTLESPTTYTKEGWLTIGLHGSQPSLGDSYNSAGSPYLCTNIFLPLGLPETDDFWAKPAEQWSAQKIWSGQDFPNDHSTP